MVDGPEYISGKLMAWAENMGIHIQYIQPGNPQQNAYIERYNRTVRQEWLNQNIFETIEPFSDASISAGQREAQEQATKWLWTYNNDRPNDGHRRDHTRNETETSRVILQADPMKKWGDYLMTQSLP